MTFITFFFGCCLVFLGKNLLIISVKYKLQNQPKFPWKFHFFVENIGNFDCFFNFFASDGSKGGGGTRACVPPQDTKKYLQNEDLDGGFVGDNQTLMLFYHLSSIFTHIS